MRVWQCKDLQIAAPGDIAEITQIGEAAAVERHLQALAWFCLMEAEGRGVLEFVADELLGDRHRGAIHQHAAAGEIATGEADQHLAGSRLIALGEVPGAARHAVLESGLAEHRAVTDRAVLTHAVGNRLACRDLEVVDAQAADRGRA